MQTLIYEFVPFENSLHPLPPHKLEMSRKTSLVSKEPHPFSVYNPLIRRQIPLSW